MRNAYQAQWAATRAGRIRAAMARAMIRWLVCEAAWLDARRAAHITLCDFIARRQQLFAVARSVIHRVTVDDLKMRSERKELFQANAQ